MARNSKPTRKLTIKYWMSLERDSKKRALTFVFPTLPFTVEMMLDETPTKEKIKNDLWGLVFGRIKEVKPEADGRRHYKTCFMNSTFIP